MDISIINYIDNYIFGVSSKYKKIHNKFIKKLIFNISKIKIKNNILSYYSELKHDIQMYYSMMYFINKNNYKYDNIKNLSFHNFNSKFIIKFTLDVNDNYSNLQITIITGTIERIDVEMITNTDKEYKCVHKNISNLQLINKSGDINIICDKLDNIIIDSLYKYIDIKLLEAIL